MVTAIKKLGNQYILEIPQAFVDRYLLADSTLHLRALKEGILIQPVHAWETQFKQAKQAGFSARLAANDGADWDTTLCDGLELS